MICLLCNKEFGNKNGLAKHLSKTHKVSSEEYTYKYLYLENIPNCKCGCGEKVSYCREVPFTYREFSAPGHYVYYNPEVWGDKSDPDRLKKGAASFKEKYARGEITHWSKGKSKENNSTLKKYSELFKRENSPDRANKISESLKGKSKSKDHVNKWKSSMKVHWESDNYKNKLRDSRMDYLINNHRHYNSKLEDIFESKYLSKSSISYVKNYYVKDIIRFYDFYISSLNILIEVDGDFWHCNPKVYPDPLYPVQIKNKEVDKIKNDWAINNNVLLLRYWEYDIYNNESIIIESLKKHQILL